MGTEPTEVWGTGITAVSGKKALAVGKKGEKRQELDC